MITTRTPVTTHVYALPVVRPRPRPLPKAGESATW
jgi:hypothetical protein